MKNTFIDLLQTINADLEKEKRWEKSKLRYYLREVLEEPPQTRGKESTYTRLTLNKLLFISRLMESNLSPSIRQLKEILANVSNEELSRIAEGQEPLEIGVRDVDETGAPGIRTIEGKFISAGDPSVGRAIQTSLGKAGTLENAAHLGAADYVAKEFSKHLGTSASMPEPSRPAWQETNFGPDLQIRYRKHLTTRQNKQLMLAGELLRSILSEEN